MGEWGEPVGKGVGQLEGSGLLAPGKPSGMSGGWVWFLPHGRGGVERGGGSCPPVGQPSIKYKYKLSCIMFNIAHST